MFDEARVLPCRLFVEVLDSRKLVPLELAITPTAERICEAVRKTMAWT